MRLYWLILVFCGLFLAEAAQCQKVLQVERAGRKKVQKYYIGDILNFKLKSEKTGYSLPIRDLDIFTGMIEFDNGSFHIDQIQEILVTKKQGAAKAWNITFVNFGAAWAVFTIVDILAGGSFHIGAVIVSGGSIALGFIIKWLFSKRKLKLGKKRRLRILDLNLSPSNFPTPIGGGP